MIIFVNVMKKLFLAILSGLFLSCSWPAIGFFPFIFFAFVPLLILERKIKKSDINYKGKQLFGYTYLAFLIFNLITTYWVWHATSYGAIAAFLANTLLMTFCFYLFSKLNNISSRLAYIGFITLWISFEYLHFNWDLSWPWLTLGNVFSNSPEIIQWYEYTGFLGGSLWVLIINLLVFSFISYKQRSTLIYLLLCLIIPIVFSQFLVKDIKQEDTLDVVIVQPNIDPYTDKFNIGYKEQLADFIELAKSELTQETDLLLGPETALLEGIWENRIESTYSIMAFRNLQEEFPNLNILVGASTYKLFKEGEELSETAREIRNQNVFYDAYNSAIFIPDSGEIQVYHKTKLVPGAEKMPFPKVLDKLGSLMINLGGIQGSLGSENENYPFEINGKVIKPLICYESIYGDLENGVSDIISIITNDGWWRETAGYKQHFAYARLRAIEERRSVIRSANTGISGVINQNGHIVQESKWDERVCLSALVNLHQEQTFYSTYGDYLGRLSVFLAFLLLISSFVKRRIN